VGGSGVAWSRARAHVCACLLGCCLALAACGRSTTSSSSARSTSTGQLASASLALGTTSASRATNTPPSGATNTTPGQATNGGVPPAAPGQAGSTPAAGAPGKATPGNGATNNPLPAPSSSPAARSRRNAALMHALTALAACMRSNGVNVPPPIVSHGAPTFDTRRVKSSGARYQQVLTRQCKAQLQGVARAAAS
jgi:hypothetical protein